jgi:hypothetical protein
METSVWECGQPRGWLHSQTKHDRNAVSTYSGMWFYLVSFDAQKEFLAGRSQKKE